MTVLRFQIKTCNDCMFAYDEYDTCRLYSVIHDYEKTLKIEYPFNDKYVHKLCPLRTQNVSIKLKPDDKGFEESIKD